MLQYLSRDRVDCPLHCLHLSIDFTGSLKEFTWRRHLTFRWIMLIKVNPCWMSIYDCYNAGCLIWNATSISIVIEDSDCKVQIKRYSRLGWVPFVMCICLRDTVVTVFIQVVLKICLCAINRSFNSEYFLKHTSIHFSIFFTTFQSLAFLLY